MMDSSLEISSSVRLLLEQVIRLGFMAWGCVALGAELDPLIEECLCLRIQTKNSDINDLAEDLAISWTSINEYLRWAEWFSKFSFNVIHIKGKANVLADILTRPPEITISKPIEMIPKPIEVFMFQPSSSKGKGKKKNTQNQPSPFSIPCQPNSHPLEVLSLILEKRFHKEAMNMMLSYQLSVFRDFGGLFLKPLGLHPDYPFINPLKFQFGEFPEEFKWMFCPEMKNLARFFKWFYPLEQWADMIMFEFLKNARFQWIVIIFYKPQYFKQNGPATHLGAFPSTWIHKMYFSEVYENPYDLKDLQKYLCQINIIIHSEIWPSGNSQAPWDVQRNPPTPYQEQLKDALREYHSNIPGPKEWSQEYPMYCSQAVQDTPAWKDIHEDTSSWKDVHEMASPNCNTPNPSPSPN
ncbi:hypothetical protein Gotri_003682 [Gossypium trilobum]|uniref:Uncharacterized protein n=1 Tax=Gossypium trilobum TaxID=34281 RepID=A0A7J9F2M4_9ROSI|nr:hypothetical protein [Gossypium trilobum]